MKKPSLYFIQMLRFAFCLILFLPKVSYAQFDKEEYAVYSVVLDSLFQKFTIHIGDSTVVYPPYLGKLRDPFEAKTKVFGWFKKRLYNFEKLGHKDPYFETQTPEQIAKTKKQLEQDSIKYSQYLKNAEWVNTFEEFKRVSNEKRGQLLVEKFKTQYCHVVRKTIPIPKRDVFSTSFSNIAFSETRKWALVYYSHYCGSMCGSDHLLVLEKIDNEWKIIYNQILMIS